MSLKRNLTTLFLILIIATATFAIALAAYSYLLPSIGTITTEYALIVEPSPINWGTFNLTTPITQQANITNTGTRNFEALNMTSNLNSGAVYNYTLTWDAEGIKLPMGYYVVANFTLTVYNATDGDFQIDIHIQDGA